MNCDEWIVDICNLSKIKKAIQDINIWLLLVSCHNHLFTDKWKAPLLISLVLLCSLCLFTLHTEDFYFTHLIRCLKASSSSTRLCWRWTDDLWKQLHVLVTVKCSSCLSLKCFLCGNRTTRLTRCRRCLVKVAASLAAAFRRQRLKAESCLKKQLMEEERRLNI